LVAAADMADQFVMVRQKGDQLLFLRQQFSLVALPVIRAGGMRERQRVVIIKALAEQHVLIVPVVEQVHLPQVVRPRQDVAPKLQSLFHRLRHHDLVPCRLPEGVFSVVQEVMRDDEIPDFLL